jgi:hydroxymethylpyrimidine/phosphomethylpyrimidine kinase
MIPVAMTIAGSDPSGGAGLQADLKAFHQHGVYGTTVVTLLTVQNTRTVLDVRTLDPSFVLAQLDAVLDDIPPAAAKTGALGTAALIDIVADRLAGCRFPVVVDPVMISKHGLALLDHDASQVLRSKLLPHAFVVTPNSLEAAVLAEMSVEDQDSMEKAAAAIGRMGPRHVLVKGGHLIDDATDVLWSDGEIHRFPGERVDTQNTHGSGCVFSAAITARLARGEDLIAAVYGAKSFVTRAIRDNPCLGGGRGPTNLHVSVPPHDLPSEG